MIIVTERKLTYKSDIKSTKEAQVFFDMIWDAFSNIENALVELTMIFIDARWHLKEGLDDSLSAYREASKKIRDRLNTISMMNSTLTRFLSNETRSIPVRANTSLEIDMQTETIVKWLKFYYKEVKKSKIPFPKFDDEVKQHQNLVVNINNNIDLINGINSAYPRMPTIRHVRNIPAIH
jgi:uncharacterized protein YpuA (DUF1002 family)